MDKFIIGKVYTARSACDYDTIFEFEVVARTAKGRWPTWPCERPSFIWSIWVGSVSA